MGVLLRLMRGQQFGISAGLGVRQPVGQTWVLRTLASGAHHWKKKQEETKTEQEKAVMVVKTRRQNLRIRTGGSRGMAVTWTAGNRPAGGFVTACGCEVWRAPRWIAQSRLARLPCPAWRLILEAANSCSSSS